MGGGALRDRLLTLLKEKAFFKERIVLSSGKESDYYIDARRVTLMAEGAYLGAQLFWEKVQKDSIEAIGGPTLGADPLVGAIAALSFKEGRPLNTFIIRKQQKSHGKQQQVEGPLLKEGSRVVIIDDVATTGKALLQALDVLSGMRVKVEKAICLVDREEGAKEALEKVGCPLESIFTVKDFLV